MHIHNDVAFSKAFKVTHSFLDGVEYEIMLLSIVHNCKRELSNAVNEIDHFEGLILHAF